jgi:hypothetical protein
MAFIGKILEIIPSCQGTCDSLPREDDPGCIVAWHLRRLWPTLAPLLERVKCWRKICLRGNGGCVCVFSGDVSLWMVNWNLQRTGFRWCDKWMAVEKMRNGFVACYASFYTEIILYCLTLLNRLSIVVLINVTLYWIVFLLLRDWQ